MSRRTSTITTCVSTTCSQTGSKATGLRTGERTAGSDMSRTTFIRTRHEKAGLNFRCESASHETETERSRARRVIASERDHCRPPRLSGPVDPPPWPAHVTVGITAGSPTDPCCNDLDEYDVVPVAERATPDWVSNPRTAGVQARSA